MGDQFYYVDKQLRKLEGKEKQELQKKIDEIDWSILDAVERRETITERGVFAPLDAVEVCHSGSSEALPPPHRNSKAPPVPPRPGV